MKHINVDDADPAAIANAVGECRKTLREAFERISQTLSELHIIHELMVARKEQHDPNTDFNDRHIAEGEAHMKTMTDEQVRALAAVLAYLEDDEAKDYGAIAVEDRADHIYTEMLKLYPLVQRGSD